MGYSTIEIDKKKALNIAKGKEVIEASKLSYFDCLYWQGRIEKAEIGDNGRIYFTLYNGDFVVVEYR